METIPLPPSFAPGMAWKGAEEVRFAPGMFKPESDSFFSYAVLFWLADNQKIDRETTERELLVYYRGLAKAVLKGKKQDVDAASFALALRATPDRDGKRPDGEKFLSFAGELKWIEPFATGKPQTLRLEIQTWRCEKQNHQIVFMCVSPQPDNAAIWRDLRAIRDGSRCR